MGRKERERRVEVFFYGLFMDEELLRGKGLYNVYGSEWQFGFLQMVPSLSNRSTSAR